MKIGFMGCTLSVDLGEVTLMFALDTVKDTQMVDYLLMNDLFTHPDLTESAARKLATIRKTIRAVSQCH